MPKLEPEVLSAVVASQSTGQHVTLDLSTGELVTRAGVILTDGCDAHEDARSPLARVFDALWGRA